MGIDYDLFIIDPNNKDTTSEQFRDCVFDALQNLNDKVELLERRKEMRKTPMMTIYKGGKRFETYTDGTTIVEDCATGEIIEEF